MDVKHFQAWAVIFKDGEPMRLSLSRGQKSSIALARRYFGVPWKALKGRGMRCVQVTIETPTAQFSGERSESAGTPGWRFGK